MKRFTMILLSLAVLFSLTACGSSEPELGAFGVNQYIYKYNLAVFRVSYDLTPSQAEEYKQAMDEIMGEVSEQYEG